MIAHTTSLVKNQIWDLFSTSHKQKRSRNKKHTSALRARIVADVPLYGSVPAALCFPCQWVHGRFAPSFLWFYSQVCLASWFRLLNTGQKGVKQRKGLQDALIPL
ncbi:hypothetical protein HN51_003683 [Arachis hypogaea]